MDLLTAINERRSVRTYLNRPIEADTREKLNAFIEDCNAEGGLHVQAVFDENRAFDCFRAHYGKFSGVSNYVVLIAKKGNDEKIGYYGEKIAVYAQTLGLNTCWVAMTYKKIKTAFTVNKGEKVYCVLSLGYGATQGVSHKIKTYEQVAEGENAPEWFISGVKAALLAPTAMNQQKFYFSYANGKVKATTKSGFYVKIDLGIAKYHFEVGANQDNSVWA